RDLAGIPGGNTGLLVRDYKGRNADQPVYKADTTLMAELRAIERQAAEELGQWDTKSEPRTISTSELIERHSEHARRARRGPRHQGRSRLYDEQRRSERHDVRPQDAGGDQTDQSGLGSRRHHVRRAR